MAFLLDRFLQWSHLFDAKCFAPESAELKFRYSRDSRRRAEQNVRSTISSPTAASGGDAELELRALGRREGHRVIEMRTQSESGFLSAAL